MGCSFLRTITNENYDLNVHVMEINSSDDFIQYTRLRSVRRRDRMRKDDLDKKLIRMHREELAIRDQIRNLGWKELNPPYQRGYIRYFALRDDVLRSNQSAFFIKVLEKINTSQWSYRKDFKKKRRKFGKKVFAVREQRLRDIEEREFFSKFSEAERSWFDESMIHLKTGKPVKVFRFTEPWRFVLRTQPNMITKVRIKDLDLERRGKEISTYFSFERRNRLYRLTDSNNWRWESRPKDKYQDPMCNRSFADFVDEHRPQSPFTDFICKPSETPGVFFFIGIKQMDFYLNF
jgi:hypothetical protein